MKKRKGSAGISKKRKNRIRQRNMRLLAAAAGIIVMVSVLCFAWLYSYVNKTEKELVCNNVFVGKSDLSGMNQKEVEAELAKQLETYKLESVELHVGEGSVSATLDELGLEMEDIGAVAKEAVSYGKEGSLWKRYKQIRKLKKDNVVLEEHFVIDEELAAQVLTEKAVPLETRAQNASVTYSGGTFVIKEEAQGNKINIEESLVAIETYLNDKWEYKNAELDLVQEVEEPEIVASDLEKIQDEIGSFWTDAGSGQRKNNLKRAVELLNGMIVMPGEEISVEATLKPFTAENGYVEAGAYENGQIVQSMAGGICQVSTTLYNALLYAEVEITERCAHSMKVNYVKPSRDAAIAEGSKDLKFKNNYSDPILIQGYIDDENRLYFFVYGKETRAEGREVEYESEVLETKEYTTKYVADSESTLGAMQEEGSGINGLTARLWKIVKENGAETSREVWNNSYYNTSDITVKVGVKSDNAEAAKMVKDAISTQDRDRIKAAIVSAQSLAAGGTGTEGE